MLLVYRLAPKATSSRNQHPLIRCSGVRTQMMESPLGNTFSCSRMDEAENHGLSGNHSYRQFWTSPFWRAIPLWSQWSNLGLEAALSILSHSWSWFFEFLSFLGRSVGDSLVPRRWLCSGREGFGTLGLESLWGREEAWVCARFGCYCNLWNAIALGSCRSW